MAYLDKIGESLKTLTATWKQKYEPNSAWQKKLMSKTAYAKEASYILWNVQT